MQSIQFYITGAVTVNDLHLRYIL